MLLYLLFPLQWWLLLLPLMAMLMKMKGGEGESVN